MQHQQQKTRPRSTTHQDTPEHTRQDTDQRDAELAEDVACCLSDIDATLEEMEEEAETAREAAERAAAIAEFSIMPGTARRINEFNRAFASLGLRAKESCCVLYLEDTDAGEIIGSR